MLEEPTSLRMDELVRPRCSYDVPRVYWEVVGLCAVIRFRKLSRWRCHGRASAPCRP